MRTLETLRKRLKRVDGDVVRFSTSYEIRKNPPSGEMEHGHSAARLSLAHKRDGDSGEADVATSG